MTFRRLGVSLVSVCALLACSNDDAIIALNVTAGADVPVVDQLHVTVTQASREFVYDFKPPIEAGSGGMGPSILNSFFQRITLPGSFTDESAVVRVEARHAGGAAFDPPLKDQTTVQIDEHGTVAAFVTLEFPTVPPPTTGEAGAGGEGGAAGEGGAGGATAEGGAGPAEAEAGAGATADVAGAGG